MGLGSGWRAAREKDERGCPPILGRSDGFCLVPAAMNVIRCS